MTERLSPDVPDSELAILELLWANGPATVRQLTEKLYRKPTEANYATVQTLLNRLEKRGHVRRERQSPAHTFTALTSRDALVGNSLRAVAEKLCGGMMSPLLTHLLRAEQLSREERQQLRTHIDELDRKNGGPDRSRK